MVTFATYLLASPKNQMTPQVAFVSLTLFSQLRVPLFMISEMIGLTVQTMISNTRLKTFFVEEELDSEAVQRETSNAFEKSIEVQTATFSWDSDRNIPATLRNIDLTINRGQLVAVVGKVGSGKSSLLSAILGEMEKRQGYVGIWGKCAYSSQQAWIQNMSLRNNILFEHEYDQLRYKQIIDACELTRDLEILPHGDYTEIGEKGINLSGGQKARVSLARALYQNSDIYFLDDPLSAVDAIVGEQIFKKAIGPEGILKDKTRILVTHSLNYLNECDLIVVINDGTITHTGKYQELIDDPNVADIFKTLQQSSEVEDEEDDEIPPELDDDESKDGEESDGSDVSAPGKINSRFVSRHSTVHSRGRKSRMTVDTELIYK
uniref:ABC transporter domain-containing protein n=1 Tax=Panagrolaimus sp. PS1159 TaxID=55785 RepID=A0AC35FVG2_9BILA